MAVIRTDSKLVVNQISGEFKIKNKKLAELNKVTQHLMGLAKEKSTIEFVYRDNN